MDVRRLPLLLLTGLLAGCQTPTASVAGGAPATTRLAVQLGPAFRTAVANTHSSLTYRVELTKFNAGSGQFEEVQSGSITSSNFASVAFSDVADGSYKVVVQAFLAGGNTYNVTKGGFVEAPISITYDGTSATRNVALTVPLLNDARKDPGDAGDVTMFHDYTLAPDSSEFVWIPRFVAYQLVNPAACGDRSRYSVADDARPPGYWVGSRPKLGQKGVDWDTVTFGGFYVGKYEACRADATFNSPGSSSNPSVKLDVVPWTGVTWDQAMEYCRKFSQQASLIGDEEWTALAVWAQINDTTVKGNNSNGADHLGGVTFSDDTTHNSGSPGRTRTGSGGPGTSHTLASDGVYDLNGNVAEWTATLGATSDGKLRVNDILTGLNAPTGGSRFDSLSTHPILRRLGLPGTLSAGGLPIFGNDGFLYSPSDTNRSLRGGSFQESSADMAGLWKIALDTARTVSGDHIGFRPVLRY
jgi:hypothetical protein